MGCAARRLKSTVIEMASFQDAVPYSSRLFRNPYLYAFPTLSLYYKQTNQSQIGNTGDKSK